jgi:hypothetical protein
MRRWGSVVVVDSAIRRRRGVTFELEDGADGRELNIHAAGHLHR